MEASHVAIVLIVSFASNLPLGKWRTYQRKFSWQWFLAIHASIPIVVALRIGLGVSLVLIPAGIACAILGQVVGARLPFPRKGAPVPVEGGKR